MASRDPATFAYRRIVMLLVWLVVAPTVLLLALGVFLLVTGEAGLNVLMGILVLALGGAVVTGVILVWVFVRREANLSQLQSDFVSKVSHELRTPLTGIRLFSETLALRRSDPEAVDACIEGLGREGSRLQSLIDRLLDWGRMESGHRQYTLVPSDVRLVIDGAVSRFDAVRERRGACVEIHVEQADLPKVNVDQEALADALLNLLTNAGKYGGDPPKIGVRVGLVGRQLRISVSDNGSGIAATEHKRIFQKFYRVDDRLSRSREGSGLGLAIAKHVVRAHGGRILLRSAPGKGSTFTVVLPVARGARKSLARETK